METVIVVSDKYTVKHTNGTALRAERNGAPWRDLCGDELVLAMAQKIEQLYDELAKYDSNGGMK